MITTVGDIAAAACMVDLNCELGTIASIRNNFDGCGTQCDGYVYSRDCLLSVSKFDFVRLVWTGCTEYASK